MGKLLDKVITLIKLIVTCVTQQNGENYETKRE